MTAKVIVFAEHDGNAIKDVSYELIGMAHGLAGDGGEVKALLLGSGADALAEGLAARGASEVLYIDGPAVASYSSDAYRKALEPVLREEAPDLVLFGHTPNGWDVAPLLAARLEAPLATGCSRIDLRDGTAHCTRKAFNGKFVHQVELSGEGPFMATVDKGASPPFEGETSGSVRKLAAAISEEDTRTRYVETKKAESGGVDLTQAQIIVSVGRGLGDPEKMGIVRELAEALGGQLGASRAVTDAGWLPHEHQIGSSGVSVDPKLYVACGISGAIQHVVGMKSSGYIVAINKDADAPIFQVADVGVVGDMFEVVPALTKAIRDQKS